MSNNALISVPFHGQNLITIQHNGEPHVAMRPIVEGIGLNWKAQYDRIQRDDVLKTTVVMMTTVAEDGKQRQLVCLPLKLLNGWLFGIDAARLKPSLREAVNTYKRECYDALYRYWHEGQATNPRFRPEKTRKALPGGLTLEQQDAVKALIKSRVEVLAHDKQAKAAITCWSAIKSKFGVSYKEVPAEHFGDVLSLVARLPLGGSLLRAAIGAYTFPASFWQTTPQERIGFLTWQDLVNAEPRPLPALLKQLTDDGNDIEGARIEYMAMRHIMELQHLIISNVARDVLSYPTRGLSVTIR
ncbi:MAG: phage antirepressor N-terminal domain-containing protein [Candidatus Competibacter denitrificans]